jgi:hypothetical protein
MTQPLEWCPVKLPIINRVVTKVPKVDTRRRARVLPLTRAISVVELAKCWKLRESVGTRLELNSLRKATGSDNPTGADNQQERPLSIQR